MKKKMNSSRCNSLFLSCVEIIKDILGLIFIGLVLLLTVPSECSSAAILYTAVSPSLIRPLSNYPIILTLEQASSPVTFQFFISSSEGSNNQILVTKDEILSPQTQTTVYLSVPALTSRTYVLKIKIFSNGVFISESNATLSSSFMNSAIFIQTDKPIYKPSDVLKYRVLLLDRNFKPFQTSKNVNLTVRDPVGNIIHSEINAEIPGKRGFLSQKLQLSSEPNLGEWKLEATLQEMPADLLTLSPSPTFSEFYQQPDPFTYAPYKETLTFNVEEYVLPKFKLNLKLTPSFVTYNSSKITAQVSPKYTFGKPVHGKCTLNLKWLSLSSREFYWLTFRTLPNSPVPHLGEISKTINVEKGSPSAFVEFDVRSELQVQPYAVTRYNQPHFSIVASCADSISGKVYNESATFLMYKFPYEIHVDYEGSRVALQRGLNNTVKIKVTTPDGKEPIGDTSTVSVNHLNYENSTTLCNLIMGETSYTFVPTGGSYSQKLEVTYKQLKETFYLSLSSYSDVGNYFKVSLDEISVPTEGKDLWLNLQSTFSFSAVNLVALSKGDVAYSNYVRLPAPAKSHRLKLKLPNRVPPTVTFVAYTYDPTRMLIYSDSIQFDVQQTARLGVKLSLSQSTSEPGKNVTITVKGLPKSVFGLRAVDESILLLKEDKTDLTEKRLALVGNRFGEMPFEYELDDLKRMLYESGLRLITNIDSESERRRQLMEQEEQRRQQLANQGVVEFNYVPTMFEDNLEISNSNSFPMMPVPAALPPPPQPTTIPSSSSSSSFKPPRVRREFPETWIWEEYVSPDGVVALEKTIPDSITSWSISAFQVNELRGLGFTPGSTSLTVMRPFFVSLNLPYSIVKGEVLALQVIVHNYQTFPTTANVTLENEQKFFRFMESPKSTSFSKQLRLKESAVSSVTFPIYAIQFGTIEIKITATCDTAGDAISVPLIVKPKGTKHIHSDSILINVSEESNSVNSHKVAPTFPEKRVKGADFVRVSVVGDILGGTMDNLEKLIKLPSGCGEQNMLHFVPDIVILDYLNATGTLAPHVSEKALEYLQTGYQRQLKYLRDDGSFSMWGKDDKNGSTWLTAFVVRSFLQAKRYICIDESVIHRSLQFLADKQNPNGSFAEDGRVADKKLQGASGQNSFALTAFVLLAFQTAQSNGINDLPNNQRIQSILKKGVDYILTGTNLSPYGNAIVAHLLSELNHPNSNTYMTNLENAIVANATRGLKHWDAKVETSGQTKPSSVETTGYALLAYVRQGKVIESMDIVRWLLHQRNSYGGFISTQDTVVGISALAKFAEKLKMQKDTSVSMQIEVYPYDTFQTVIQEGAKLELESEEMSSDELTVSLSHDENFGISPAHTFYIGQENITTLQEFILPVNITEIHLVAEGAGTALAQLTWSYYIEESVEGNDLKLTVNAVSKEKGEILELEICTAVLKGEPTNMAIVEVFAPSGFEFDEDHLDTLNEEKVFSKWEPNEKNSLVNLYFNSFGSREICFKLIANRMTLIAKLAKTSVRVYDYYEPTRETQTLYSVASPTVCDLCSSDDSVDCTKAPECSP